MTDIKRTLVQSRTAILDGDLRTTFKSGADTITIFWSKVEGNFYAAMQEACRFTPARTAPKAIFTEQVRRGRWYTVSVGDDCPCF